MGALLAASATLFNIVKLAGAGYLIFIGLRMLLGKKHLASDGDAPPKRSARLFSEGLITQLSNPKAIVFFSALLPQFVSPATAGINRTVAEQFAVLALISVFIELAVLSSYGWAADRGSDHLFFRMLRLLLVSPKPPKKE